MKVNLLIPHKYQNERIRTRIKIKIKCNFDRLILQNLLENLLIISTKSVILISHLICKKEEINI
jgi:hypothetical protein